MKSTLLNMVLVLFGVTFVGSVGVGGVYMLTKEPINEAKKKAQMVAVHEVLPSFESTTGQTLVVDDEYVNVYTAYKADSVVGYAVETLSKNGFGGVVRVMVGFGADGVINNIVVLEQTETPGLGTKMTEVDNPLLRSLQGKNPADLKLSVKKDGGDVDALTAATISSRAYVDAVAKAYAVFVKIRYNKEWKADAASGASQQEWEQTDSLAAQDDVVAQTAPSAEQAKSNKK